MFPQLSDFPMACYSKDKQGDYLFVSPGFLLHANIQNVSDLLGRKDSELPWADYAASMMENDARIVKTGINQVFLENGLYKGKLQWCRSFKSPFLGRDGKAHAFYENLGYDDHHKIGTTYFSKLL